MERESSSLWQLSIAGTILAGVLLNQLNEYLNRQGFYQKANIDSGRTEEQLTWSSQQDSLKGTECGPHELCQPYKEFDTVSCERFWKIMTKFGCLAKFMVLMLQFHDGMLARVQNDGEFSDPIPCDKWS